MTDKQIIIDGVDVSKCSYFQQEDDEYTCGAEECNGAIVACRACDNCYYKQLKRSEAQCEAMFVSHTDLEKKYKRKEQECEELKDLAAHNGRVCNTRLDKIDELEHDINELNGQLDQLKAENEELKKCYKNNSALLYFEETNTTKLVNKVMKLEKTLTEIKEIARVGAFYWKHYKEESKRYNEILQKISEVENEKI
jgi:predicted RNase H-like nuclease (RuvC/YqgF family)